MKVLVFGTFDGLHKGHEFFLSEAAKYGDELYVVIALDETVEKIKKRKPVYSETERLTKVQDYVAVYKAVLGHPGDKYKVIEEIRPGVICLGYDQTAFIDKLPAALKERGIDAKIVRLNAYHPEKYKSSLLNNSK